MTILVAYKTIKQALGCSLTNGRSPHNEEAVDALARVWTRLQVGHAANCICKPARRTVNRSMLDKPARVDPRCVVYRTENV